MDRHIVKKLPTDALGFYQLSDAFCNQPFFIFLDSRLQSDRLSRFSYISFSPFCTIRSRGDDVWVDSGITPPIQYKGSVFEIIQKQMKTFHYQRQPDKFAPFTSGLMGYFGYELGRQIEHLPQTTEAVLGIETCYVGLYHFVIILCHKTGDVLLSYFDPHCDQPTLSISEVQEIINKELSVQKTSKKNAEESDSFQDSATLEKFIGDFNKDQYMAAVRKVKEYIFAGDIFQANLTQRFSKPFERSQGWQLYKRLMQVNPAPFSAYLQYPDFTVLCSSPERFWSLNNRRVETRPIKGTIRRDRDPRKDAQQKNRLLKSEKDKAELAMIVDLLRNDIGRVCKAGSVRVQAFPELETYPSVHHLASTITGELLDDKDAIDLLVATFPGGSITGAPKIRAMEIIDELEPIERGIYTGSIGYICFDGDADLNIVIRTILLSKDQAHIQVGGGIVADSTEESEYHETLLKGKNLAKALL